MDFISSLLGRHTLYRDNIYKIIEVNADAGYVVLNDNETLLLFEDLSLID
jgi:hypothetical protein